MKAWEVVGWTGDADVWCVACARPLYGARPELVTHDSEGNEVRPIFASDVQGERCGSCGEELLG